ncbi:MAG: hypothetical protein WCP79_06750 [Bacillota bacterium]
MLNKKEQRSFVQQVAENLKKGNAEIERRKQEFAEQWSKFGERKPVQWSKKKA